jgi:prepilin-type N-terminal cleavage/methylation domain-containing protein
MGRRLPERGFTLIEIMIVVAIIALLAAVAIPNILRGRTTSNESAAIGNIRALISSLEMFRSVNNAYPDGDNNFRTRMYGADCAAATAPVPDFGPPSFCLVLDAGAADVVQGYIYDYDAPAAPAATYELLAIPQTLNTTGSRSFYATEAGLVRHCLGTGTFANMVDEPTIDAPVDAGCA